MPAATAPVGKPAGFTKPAGFSKPAGFGKKAAEVEEEDDEPKKDSPVIIVLAALTLIIMGLVCFKQYQTDQTPGRVSEYTFGSPTAGGDEAVSDDSGYAEEESSSGESEDYADEEE